MNDPKRIVVNAGSATELGAHNRGLAYGDGLFETILIRGGRAPLLDRHLDRVTNDARKLGIDDLNRAALTSAVENFIAGCDTQAIVKLIVVRESRGRGYAFGPASGCHTVLLEYSAAGDELPSSDRHHRMGICETRLGLNPALAGMKHLNRLEQVLGAEEMRARNLDEGIMLDGSGRVIEATRSNLFFVCGGSLRTPGLNEAGVAGVMRQLVLEIATDKGFPVDIGDISLADVMEAEEIFACNAVSGIVPVIELDGREWKVGPITKSLQHDLEKWLDTRE